jgi:hypothetical protein
LKTSLAVVFLSLSLNSQAQSYPQKLAALQERVNLDLGIFLPEIEKAAAVNQLYTLVFQSNANHYFDKKSGLVRAIVLREIFRKEPTADDLSGVTRLQGHVLHYPTKFDATSIILSRLAEEAQIMNSIPGAVASLKRLVPNMQITFESDGAYAATNSNVSRLQLLNDLQTVLSSNPAVVNGIRSYKKFSVVDNTSSSITNSLLFWTDTYGRTTDHYATLNVGRDGIYNKTPYFNATLLESVLKLAFIDGFGSKAGYFMKPAQFASSIAALNAYLLNSGKADQLQAGGVDGFEFEEGYEDRERLFQNGILTVGTTEEGIRRVVELFFP